jgi:tRNA (cmo5U34)-methyltransferase
VSLEKKSSIEEICARFDQDVERFSQLETGQQATMDAPLVLELVAACGKNHLKPGDALLDVGCGAGNFTLRVLQDSPGLHCHLADLSRPMLDRAEQRVRDSGAAKAIETHQGDIRSLPAGTFSCILAGAVLHHLRDDADWQREFARFHAWLKPGGRLYVADLCYFELPDVQETMWARYGRYLEGLKGPEYRETVFAYIDKEDSPRSLPFQLDLLRASGFSAWDVLHRNSVFACYVGVKSCGRQSFGGAAHHVRG